MTTFDIVGRYFPFLLLFGVGLCLVLVAVIPSWRKKGMIHSEIYMGSWKSKDEPTVIAEWDLSEETSAKVNAIVGGLLIIGGIAGVIWISHLK